MFCEHVKINGKVPLGQVHRTVGLIRVKTGK